MSVCAVCLPCVARRQKPYIFCDAEGAAEHMIFYEQREKGGLTPDRARVEQKRKCFRRLNGLFFTVMVLRTAVPLVVASRLVCSSRNHRGKGVHHLAQLSSSQPEASRPFALSQKSCRLHAEQLQKEGVRQLCAKASVGCHRIGNYQGVADRPELGVLF